MAERTKVQHSSIGRQLRSPDWNTNSALQLCMPVEEVYRLSAVECHTSLHDWA